MYDSKKKSRWFPFITRLLLINFICHRLKTCLSSIVIMLFCITKSKQRRKKNILINVLFRPLVAFRWLSVTLFFFLSICFRFNSCQFQCDSKWNLNKHSIYHFHNESCAKSDIVLHFVIEWNSPAGISSELKLKLKFLWNRSRNWNWN